MSEMYGVTALQKLSEVLSVDFMRIHADGPLQRQKIGHTDKETQTLLALELQVI